MIYRLILVPYKLDEDGAIVPDPDLQSVEWHGRIITDKEATFVKVREPLDIHALYEKCIGAKEYPDPPEHVKINDMTGVM